MRIGGGPQRARSSVRYWMASACSVDGVGGGRIGDGAGHAEEAVVGACGEAQAGDGQAEEARGVGRERVIAPAHVGKLARAAINDYSPQFPLRLMNKDFQLILKAAAHEHLPMPATDAAFRVNSEELAHHDEEDFSTVLRRMEEVASIAEIHSAPTMR